MSLYTLSEFMTLLKEDIGIRDIPLPVSDEDLVKRFQNSSLKEFSTRYPRREKVLITDEDREKQTPYVTPKHPVIYHIPKSVYEDTSCRSVLMVTSFEITRPTGYADMYVPGGIWAGADTTIETLADIRIAAQLGSAMSRAMTYEFRQPDIIYVYDGWMGGVYEAEVGLMHDINLSTIPDTAFTNLRELATYDLEAYLYSQFKRKDNLDLGVANIDLKTEEWQSAGENMRNLLKEWDQTVNLDLEQIQYW
jgi:hypothetical protein